VAIKLCASADEVPAEALIPSRDLGHRILPCHALARARRMGQTVAVGPDDSQCPYGEIVLGFAPAAKGYQEGWVTEYLTTKEAAAKTAAEIARLEHGKYAYLLTAPLATASFTPDMIAIYCDGAQLMRLIQGALRGKGGAVTSKCMGAFGCSRTIAWTLISNECHYHIPGGGERMSALTQDHEVVFAAPMDKVDGLLEGLRSGAEAHFTDYPIRGNLGAEPQLPKSYATLREHIHGGGKPGDGTSGR
jgi:uncharacterized protein (DUF169 family)